MRVIITAISSGTISSLVGVKRLKAFLGAQIESNGHRIPLHSLIYKTAETRRAIHSLSSLCRKPPGPTHLDPDYVIHI